MSVTYPNAFSTELREELSSERAHSLSVKKILSDSKSFQCSEDCSTFKLTLTNFGKKDYIYSPYFRPGGLNQSHAPNCSLMKKIMKTVLVHKKQVIFFHELIVILLWI